MGHQRICDHDNARCQIKHFIKFNKFQFVELYEMKKHRKILKILRCFFPMGQKICCTAFRRGFFLSQFVESVHRLILTPDNRRSGEKGYAYGLSNQRLPTDAPRRAASKRRRLSRCLRLRDGAVRRAVPDGQTDACARHGLCTGSYL